MPEQSVHTFSWLGKDTACLDFPSLAKCHDVIIGRYGGNTQAGASKNEDAALVWCTDNWEFAVVIDAHFSSQSAALIIKFINDGKNAIVDRLSQPLETAFVHLRQYLVEMFASSKFLEQCRLVFGEASCLICARKGRFLWWMGIGDCVVYLLHTELARLGQYALNQRSFFEWIGQRNTFELPVPCYATGVRELLPGHNRIVMTTDGLLEYDDCPFQNPEFLYRFFGQNADLSTAVEGALERVHTAYGRDSATVIAWDYNV